MRHRVSGPGLYDLGCCVAQLAASGHRVELTRWDAAFAELEIGSLLSEEAGDGSFV